MKKRGGNRRKGEAGLGKEKYLIKFFEIRIFGGCACAGFGSMKGSMDDRSRSLDVTMSRRR